MKSKNMRRTYVQTSGFLCINASPKCIVVERTTTDETVSYRYILADGDALPLHSLLVSTADSLANALLELKSKCEKHLDEGDDLDCAIEVIGNVIATGRVIEKDAPPVVQRPIASTVSLAPLASEERKKQDSILAKFAPLAHKLAKKYSRPDRTEYEDVLQVAKLGILEAAKTYDPSRNATLQTHIYNRATFAVQHQMRENTGMIYVPYRVDHETPEKVPERIDLDDKNWETIRGDNGFTPDSDRRVVINDAMMRLTETERKIFWLLVVCDYSHDMVCKELGVNKGQMQTLYKQAVQKLYKYMNEHNISAEILMGK